MGERVDEIAAGVLRQAFRGHLAAGGIPDQAFQLIAPMRGDLSVGVERKALHTGTAGTGQCGMFPSLAKPRADAPDLLAGPLPKGDALLHGGRHGLGQLRRVITQGGIACGRRSVEARL